MLGFSKYFRKPPELVAAIDLGSNSFHMIVARVTDGQLQIIDRLREMVRLGAGLQEDKTLTDEAKDRALACLGRFGQRLHSMPDGSVRAVGTNTLRQVQDSGNFLVLAEQALGHPIEIVTGREEARLVYLGVSHGLAASDDRRLVIDIGGGSTELIIGEAFEPIQRESLHMGCVSMSRAWFGDGRISSKNMDRARLAARLEVRPVEVSYRNTGWNTAVGSSGTIRSIRDIVQAAGWSDAGITLDSMRQMRESLLKAGSVKNLKLEGLSEDRRPVIPGGFAVLFGVFEALGIEQMSVSDEALREGLLYDLVGRIRHDDIRGRTVTTLSVRCGVESEHAARVESTALHLLGQVEKPWGLSRDDFGDMLSWAAHLHEAGLAISHSQYQKHGAYLLEHSDLSGFSGSEQRILAALVRGHRRKFPRTIFDALPNPCDGPAIKLCVLLRLAVLFHRSRDDTQPPRIRARAGKGSLNLLFPKGWLEAHPLTEFELEREAAYLKAADVTLTYT
ncbi:MAG: exopolyphosphatase [Pseudomonadota bacterium]|nr:exopolyphosphatase [Pseudomonadota bacterium]